MIAYAVPHERTSAYRKRLAYERVELIDGVIFDMPTPDIDHAWIVDRLSSLLHGSFGSSVAISVGPLRLDDYNEFIPDITLLIKPLSRYRHRFPTGEY